MARVARLAGLPPNMDEFVREIGDGIEALYGPEARRDYARRARPILRNAIAQPDVQAFEAREEGTVAGILIARLSGAVGRISLVHVLRPFLHSNAEGGLVERAVAALRRGGVDGILCEFVALYPDRLGHHLGPLGFDIVPRELMMAPADAPGLEAPGAARTLPLARSHPARLADCMVAAYAGSTGPRIHEEARDRARARAFIEQAVRGGFGKTRDAFSRVVLESGRPAGAALGCVAAPGTAFVLHVFVDPALQGRGLGTRLLREQARAFSEDRLARIALGVTSASPARALYDRLGFRTVRPVTACAWWRE